MHKNHSGASAGGPARQRSAGQIGESVRASQELGQSQKVTLSIDSHAAGSPNRRGSSLSLPGSAVASRTPGYARPRVRSTVTIWTASVLAWFLALQPSTRTSRQSVMRRPRVNHGRGQGGHAWQPACFGSRRSRPAKRAACCGAISRRARGSRRGRPWPWRRSLHRRDHGSGAGTGSLSAGSSAWPAV
jgi:hypothetical protein